jgi:hypothetical protein
MRGALSTGPVAVVSTTGLVEAPARPAELERAYNGNLSIPRLETPELHAKLMAYLQQNNGTLNPHGIHAYIESLFADRMLSYEDPRMNEAVRGYLMSMMMMSMGEYGQAARCSTSGPQLDTSKTCRLHDAHRQEELIASQVHDHGGPEFCGYHEELFDLLQKGK